jgi:hypothetical protein
MGGIGDESVVERVLFDSSGIDGILMFGLREFRVTLDGFQCYLVKRRVE